MAAEATPAYCPLCGNGHARAEYSEGFGWGVYCGFCNCNVYGYKTREGAVKQWNHGRKPKGGNYGDQ